MSLWSRLRQVFRGALRRPLLRYVYAGAQQSRLFEDWITSWMSGRDEARWEMRMLRNRAREQARNNPLARRYLGLCVENVLGPKGIVMQARNVLPTGEADEETNQQIELAWQQWCEADTCSADGRYCFAEMQAMALETERRDGECLVELLPGFPNAFGFAIRLIDADLLDETYNVSRGEGRNAIVQGVELDRWNRPIAYHLWNEHPTALVATTLNRKRIRVDAANLRYIGWPMRIDMVRAVTPFAPVLTKLKMLDEYMNSEVAAARAHADKLGFITTSPDATPPDPNDPLAGQQTLESSAVTINRLAQGESFVGFDPTHPNTAFDPFVKAMTRQVAAGFGVSYHALSADVSQANYSSTRVASLDERANWEVMQRRFAGAFCEPIARMWLRQAVIWQQLRLPGRVADYQAREWQCRGWDWVDPEKDIAASLREVEAGLTSLTDLAAARGVDFRTTLMKIAADQQLAEQLGVTLKLSSGTAQAPEAPESEPVPQRRTRRNEKAPGGSLRPAG